MSFQGIKKPNYKQYIQSPEWRERREECCRYYDNRCAICYAGDKSLDVHHRTYDRLGREWASDLVLLCRACHEKYHSELDPNEWPGFVLIVEEKEVALAACLTAGTIKSFGEDRIVLGYAKKFSFEMDQVELPWNQEFLECMTAKYFGRVIDIICVPEPELS